MHRQMNGMKWSATTGKRQKVWSTIPIVASLNKTFEESKQAEGALFWPYDCIWGQLVTQARLIVNSQLRSQSSCDCRTHSKSKSGISTLSQKTLKDCGSVKLSILLSERTSWLLIVEMLANHTQLLIAHVCMQNGNGMVNGNAKHHHFSASDYSYQPMRITVLDRLVVKGIASCVFGSSHQSS